MNQQMLENAGAGRQDSPGWIFFVKVSFTAALAGMVFGIAVMPVEIWVRGYMILGTLFLVGSTFTLQMPVVSKPPAAGTKSAGGPPKQVREAIK